MQIQTHYSRGTVHRPFQSRSFWANCWLWISVQVESYKGRETIGAKADENELRHASECALPLDKALQTKAGIACAEEHSVQSEADLKKLKSSIMKLEK